MVLFDYLFFQEQTGHNTVSLSKSTAALTCFAGPCDSRGSQKPDPEAVCNNGSSTSYYKGTALRVFLFCAGMTKHMIDIDNRF